MLVFTFERPESVDKIVDSWQQLLTHSFTQPALYEAKCIVWLDAQARSFWPGSERGETRVFMCSRALVVTARSFRIVVSREEKWEMLKRRNMSPVVSTSALRHLIA